MSFGKEPMKFNHPNCPMSISDSGIGRILEGLMYGTNLSNNNEVVYD